MATVTENPAVGATEVWELYNATADAHPIHIHEIVFEVINRQNITVDDGAGTVQVNPGSAPMPRQPWETGFKDTVTAFPGQVTRVRAQFNTPGQFVWHCHIVEHEDNEMMRPYSIGPVQTRNAVIAAPTTLIPTAPGGLFGTGVLIYSGCPQGGPFCPQNWRYGNIFGGYYWGGQVSYQILPLPVYRRVSFSIS